MSKAEKRKHTREQLELQKIIEGLGFETVLEYMFGQYFVDIYCTELHLGFEFDGPMHISKNRDNARDEELFEKYGLRLFHVTDLKDENLISDIEEFIDGSCN